MDITKGTDPKLQNFAGDFYIIPLNPGYFLLYGDIEPAKLIADGALIDAKIISDELQQYNGILNESITGIAEQIGDNIIIAYKIPQDICWQIRTFRITNDRNLICDSKLAIQCPNSCMCVKKTANKRYWMWDGYLLDITTCEIIQFNAAENNELNNRFTKISDKIIGYDFSAKETLTGLFDVNTKNIYWYPGRAKIVISPGDCAVFIFDTGFKLFKKNNTVQNPAPNISSGCLLAHYSPEKLSAIKNEDCIELKYVCDSFESYTCIINYTPHWYVRNVEMLYNIIIDVIKGMPNVCGKLEKINDNLKFIITFNDKYNTDILEYELVRDVYNEIELLKSHVEWLIKIVQQYK